MEQLFFLMRVASLTHTKQKMVVDHKFGLRPFYHDHALVGKKFARQQTTPKKFASGANIFGSMHSKLTNASSLPRYQYTSALFPLEI